MSKPEVSKSTSTASHSNNASNGVSGDKKNGKSAKQANSISPEQVGLYKSIGLHFFIAALLLISVSFSPDPLSSMPSNAPVIEATFIDAQAIADQKREQAQAEARRRGNHQVRHEHVESFEHGVL